MSKRKASSEPPAVSSRAARTGRGAVGLNEAAGSLDADYETLGVLGRGNFSEINLLRSRGTKELFALTTVHETLFSGIAH